MVHFPPLLLSAVRLRRLAYISRIIPANWPAKAIDHPLPFVDPAMSAPGNFGHSPGTTSAANDPTRPWNDPLAGPDHTISRSNVWYTSLQTGTRCSVITDGP
jgi:hypothetical protein